MEANNSWITSAGVVQCVNIIKEACEKHGDIQCKPLVKVESSALNQNLAHKDAVVETPQDLCEVQVKVIDDWNGVEYDASPILINMSGVDKQEQHLLQCGYQAEAKVNLVYEIPQVLDDDRCSHSTEAVRLFPNT